jgi:hypothetical protein
VLSPVFFNRRTVVLPFSKGPTKRLITAFR